MPDAKSDFRGRPQEIILTRTAGYNRIERIGEQSALLGKAMCGIAGYFLRERNAELAQISAMCDEIRHRGPDHQGYHVEGRCGIGMRRLSIIDLAGGRQPLSNEDGTVWTVFNGEIYNYRELREELRARGHRFKTRSDTEVLVHLYEEHGTDGIQKLRGMFAYAIWDSRNRSLLLVRDRFGKKPLYYALSDGLYFASELKSLRRAGVPLELDRDALQLYFLLNFIPDPWSPYRGVRKLAPGGWLRYHADGRVEEGRYWTLPCPSEEADPGLDEACGARAVARGIRRCGPGAPGLRCSSGSVPERRHRFRIRGRVHGSAASFAGKDVFHRIC